MNLLLLAVAEAVLLAGAAPVADVRHTYKLPSGVAVTVVESPFAKGHFNVVGCDKDNAPCRINGKIPFGLTGKLPTTFLSRFSIEWKGTTHVLDSSDMYDAWGTRPLEYAPGARYLGALCFDSRNCHVRGVFSDGAGTFVAEWVIVAGVSRRTVLTSSSDVVDTIMKNIDPPTFN